jgi:hypothetical protein
MRVSRAFQKALVATLKAHAGVSALVGSRVYDVVPVTAVFPYISLGPSSVVPDCADCIDGREEMVQLDVWDRSSGLTHPCPAITDALCLALHKVTLTLEDLFANVETNVTLMQAFLDPDGLTG